MEKLRTVIDGLDSQKLKVGWLESAKYDAGTPVAGIAAVHEFGSPKMGIPARPFMLPAVEENKENWALIVGRGAKAALNDNGSILDTLELLGLSVSGEVRANISRLQDPPLSPVTLALRKQKLAGNEITGSVVAATREAVAKGETGPGQLGDSAGVSTKPLVVNGYLMQTVTHMVE